MRERAFEFFELGRRAVHFDPDKISHLEHLREQCADVLDVRQKAFRVCVTFAAKHIVAVSTETIKEILALRRGLFDEGREAGLDRLPFSGMRFEIGMKGDEV